MQTQLPVSREIQRALDIVENHLNRVEPVYERRREHRRQRVHKRLLLFPYGRRDQSAVEAWSYEVSRGGMGFVCEAAIPVAPILLGFDLDGETPIWMNAEVKHCKEVMDGVYACGVQFLGRANSSG